MEKKLSLTVYKKDLFEALLSAEPEEKFRELILKLSAQGNNKRWIYKLFLDFHSQIQIDLRTKDREDLYDRLSDFMDGFTDWGKYQKILPDEPDVHF